VLVPCIGALRAREAARANALLLSLQGSDATYWGSYALNVLELEPHVIAEQLGHQDGGRLVVQLYGHPDGALARRKIREAHDRAGAVTPL